MKQKRLIQFLVGGFPFLLVVAVIGGLAFYYYGPSDFGMVTERPRGSEEMVRAEPLSEEGVGGYVKLFAGVLGGRPPGDLGAQARAGKYLDSTLGVRNTGYRVRRPLADAEAMQWLVIEAEVPGVRKPDEVVVVSAMLDSAGEDPSGSTGLAVVLAVARSMVAASPERTVRFVFASGDETVKQRYAAVPGRPGERIVELIEIGRSVAGEISVGEAEGLPGVQAGKQRRIAGVAGAEVSASELFEVAKQIETTITLAGRAQK